MLTTEHHTEVMVDSPKSIGKIFVLECSMDFFDAESIKFVLLCHEINDVHYFPEDMDYWRCTCCINNDLGTTFELGYVCDEEQTARNKTRPMARSIYDADDLTNTLYQVWEDRTTADLGTMEDKELQERFNWIQNEVDALIEKHKIVMPND